MYFIGLLKEFVRQGYPCLFRSLTGLYCPGCGGTRAAKFLLHGDICKSLWYHPLVGYMVLTAAAEFGAWGLRRWRAGSMVSRQKSSWQGKENQTGPARFLGHYEIEVYVGIGITLVNWAVKNWVLLVMGVRMIP